MSDTPAEKWDHFEAVEKAKGNMLINGLGLGMFARACLLKDVVTHMTVVEKSPDVIKLVAPYLQKEFGDKVKIVEADALEFHPPKGMRFGAVWHDIWDNICSDNLPEMHKLHRRYGRKTEYQGSWGRVDLEAF